MNAIRDLLTENPMTFEGTRIWRRFLRSGPEGGAGRNVNRIALGVLALMYAWLFLVIIRFHEDLSQMLLYFELGVLTLAVPASLYGAISQEREKQTWDSLLMTRLSPGQILTGKLLWRFLLILATMALFALPTFLCHAVSVNGTDYTWTALWQIQGVLLAWSLFLAGFTIMVSAKTKRSITTLAVVVVALLTFLGLAPTLYSLFGGGDLTPVLGYRVDRDPYARGNTYGSAQGLEPTPMLLTGAIVVAANPVSVLESARVSYRYTRVQPPQSGVTTYTTILTLAYLLGAWACVGGALKALRRMELPENDAARGITRLAAARAREGGDAHADLG